MSSAHPWTKEQLDRGRQLAGSDARRTNDPDGAPGIGAAVCQRIRRRLGDGDHDAAAIAQRSWAPCRETVIKHAKDDCQHDHDVPPVAHDGREWRYTEGER